MRYLNAQESEWLLDLSNEIGVSGILLNLARLRDQEAESLEMQASVGGNGDAWQEAQSIARMRAT